MEIKIAETYHVTSCCCPQYVHEVLGENSLLHLSYYDTVSLGYLEMEPASSFKNAIMH